MLEAQEFGSVFKQIEDLFDVLKERLFIDEWLREKTKLVFGLVDKTKAHNKIYLFESRKERTYHIIEYDIGSFDTYSAAFDDCIHQEYKNQKYIKQMFRLSKYKEYKVNVWNICWCPCLNENEGKLLFRKTFFQFFESLREWCHKLEKEKPNKDGKLQLPSIENKDEFVQSVLERAALKVCEDLQNLYFPVKLAYINMLSGEYYEKAEGRSNLLFLPNINSDKIPASVLVYDFRKSGIWKSDIEFIPKNIRWIRKLTQMAQEDLYLVFQVCPDKQGYEVLGLCKEENISCLIPNCSAKIPYFTIKIRKHMYWDLFLGSTYIFTYVNGEYRITKGLSLEYLSEKCNRVFGVSSDYTKIIESILETRHQTHGTMLVILSKDDAEWETRRLVEVNQGMRNAEPGTQQGVLNRINSIDGSVLMDTDGKVYGIGMILDGDTNTKGNLARGARYNSALKYQRYLETAGKRGMIVIVSEDGSIEILSAL